MGKPVQRSPAPGDGRETPAEGRGITQQLEEQLRFSRALNEIADAVLAEEDAQGLLDAIVCLLGRILEVDRALIFDVRFDEGLAEGLCEWLNAEKEGITPTRASYPLELFREGAELMRKTKRWMESHDDEPHPCFVQDGSAIRLHEGMNIHSLLWYPFFFREDGYYLLVFNQVDHGRRWKPEELVFLDAVTRQVNLALQKLQLLAERRRAERERKASLDRLTRTLAELKRAQDQLIMRERLAAVGQLSAGIAHDFNNVLTVVLGVSELLESRDDLPEDVLESLRLVSASGRRAARLVRQLLDFSGRTVRQARTIDLRLLCEEATSFLRRTLPETIDLRLEAGSGEFLVEGDPAQFQELLTNLALNARDAMPDGGSIELRLERIESEDGDRCALCTEVIRGEWIRLACRDTGRGIPPADLGRVFEPFFSTKKKGEGTGLGLAQVAGIVRQHGGHLAVSSDPSWGSLFSLYLPLASAGQPASRSAGHAPSPQGRGERILVIEDDSTVRKVTARMLASLGYQVQTAESGSSALELLEKEPSAFALVLSDMVMPGMDGLELLRELRRIQPRMKAVIMSGYPLGEEGRGLLEQGKLRFIQKPVHLSILSRVIRDALEGC